MAIAFGARVLCGSVPRYADAGADCIGQARLAPLQTTDYPPKTVPIEKRLTQQLGYCALLGEHMLGQIVAPQAKA